MKKDTKDSTLVVIPRKFGNLEKYFSYIEPEKEIIKGKLRFLGGKLKVGEDYLTTLKDEAFEEYGVQISNIKLLYQKKNIYGARLFLCSGIISGEPKKMEKQVGEPEWKSAEELFSSNLFPNCKINLYCYLSKNKPKKLDSLIPIIKDNKEFLSFLPNEAPEIYSDLMERIRKNTLQSLNKE